MVDFLSNPCGGARWRTLSDGTVEIEGMGVPTYDPSDGRFSNLARTWSNFSSELSSAARVSAVPLPWVLAFASVETGFLSDNSLAQAQAVSPVGALGVMQLMPQYFTAYSRDQLLTPAINISVAAAFIKKLCQSTCANRCELPVLGSIYNAGAGSGCIQCKSGNTFGFAMDGDYSLALVTYNNTAIQRMSLALPTWPWVIAGGVTAAAAAWFLI